VLAAVIAALLLLSMFVFGEQIGLVGVTAQPAYVGRLFDDSRVQRIDILLDDWPSFLAEAEKEQYREATFVINGERISHVGVRLKGNSSMRLALKYGHDRLSMKVKFDHYVSGQTFRGLDEFSLDSSFQDNSYLKTYLAYDMMRHMDVPAPLTSFAWVTVNGDDHGLFLAIEEPNESFARRNFGLDYGQLYKPDYRSLDDDNRDVWLVYRGDDPAGYDNIFRKARFRPTESDKARLIESLRVLGSRENLASVIDVDKVVRYFAVHNFVVNLDGYLGRTAHNYFLYEEDGVLSMLPWDYNLAFGTYSLGMPNPINDAKLYINYPIFTPGELKHIENRPMFHHVMQDKAHFALYRQRFDEFIASYFESGLFSKKVLTMADQIAPYVDKDPTAFCSYDDHLVAVQTIMDFGLLRAESVRGQLAGTIPGTSRGQREDPSRLIDAGSVWLPDMGEIADLKD